MTTPTAVWTKTTPDPTVTHYDHANGLRLSHYVHGSGFWTTTSKEAPRSATPALTALGTLAYTLYCRESFIATALPTEDQIVQAIADLHFGGLP